MGKLVLFPKGCLSPKDKERATKAGFCVIECEQPDKVVMLDPIPDVRPDMLLMAALQAMCEGGYDNEKSRAKFTQILFSKLSAKEATC